MTPRITQEALKSILEYDQNTGVFKWIKRLSKRVHVGDIAGHLVDDGYVLIGIGRSVYRAHILAWLYVHGEYPNSQIDHINQNKQDNRILNLRLVSKKQNMENRGSQKNNTTGFKGVSWHKQRKKFVAWIKHNGKQRYLGIYASAEQAYSAYQKAAAELHTHNPHAHEVAF